MTSLHPKRRPRKSRDPHRVVNLGPLLVTDGRDHVGTIELIDGQFIAIDATGNVVGRFQHLRTAMCSLPPRGAP
jgi:hypothetical protein